MNSLCMLALLELAFIRVQFGTVMRHSIEVETMHG